MSMPGKLEIAHEAALKRTFLGRLRNIPKKEESSQQPPTKVGGLSLELPATIGRLTGGPPRQDMPGRGKFHRRP